MPLFIFLLSFFYDHILNKILIIFLGSYLKQDIVLKNYCFSFYHNNTVLIYKLLSIYPPFKDRFNEFSQQMDKLVNIIIQKISGKTDFNLSAEYDMVSDYFIKTDIIGEISYLKDANLYFNILDILKNNKYEKIYLSLWCDVKQ